MPERRCRICLSLTATLTTQETAGSFRMKEPESALEHPEYTEGTISILAEVAARKILFTWDLFILKPCTPADELQIKIIRPCGPDYNEEKNLGPMKTMQISQLHITGNIVWMPLQS